MHSWSRLSYRLLRGGSGIKYYELGDGDSSNGNSLPSIHFCHEYKAVGDPLSGLAVLPPQSLDIARVEVARLLRLTATSVEPVSLMLPRSGDLKDYFQDDVYRWVWCRALVKCEHCNDGILYGCVCVQHIGGGTRDVVVRTNLWALQGS